MSTIAPLRCTLAVEPGCRRRRGLDGSDALLDRPRGAGRTIVFDALACLQPADELVDDVRPRRGTSGPATPAGVTISGVPSSVTPMNATLIAAPNSGSRTAGAAGSASVSSMTFAARYWKNAPPNGVAVLAAVDGMAAAVLHPEQLGVPSSNSWLPTPMTSRPGAVQRLDRRLVVEEPREQRAGADHVAGADEQRVPGSRPRSTLQVRREVLHAARRRVDVRVRARPDHAARAGRRLQVAVEVVEREQLHLDRAARRRVRSRAGLPGDDRCDEQRWEQRRECLPHPHLPPRLALPPGAGVVSPIIDDRLRRVEWRARGRALHSGKRDYATRVMRFCGPGAMPPGLARR